MAATTAAVVGIAATVAGTGMSFSEASKQRKAATTARIEADKAIQEARKRAEENVYKALSLSKEPYNRAREAALVQGAQAVEAGVESERGIGATAGRVQMAQNELQRDISGEQTQQIQALNMTVAEEDARLKDYAAKISMAEAEGAQQAMRDAEERRAASITQGVQGLASTAGQVGQSLNLYQKSEGAKAYDKLIKQGLAAGKTQEQIQNIVAAQGGPLAGMGYSKTSVDANGKPIVGFQTPIQFQDALSQDAKMVNELLKLNLFSPKPIPTTESMGMSTTVPPQASGTPFNTNLPGAGYYGGSSLNPFDIYGR
jgi:hypothetical protein